MKRLVAVLLVVLAAVGAARAADRYDALFEPFDAAALTRGEKRLLQSALAAEGHYAGRLDGAWGAISQEAIAAFARDGASHDAGAGPGAEALNMHAAAAFLLFLDELDDGGWDFGYLPDLDVSFVLPHGALGPPQRSAGRRRWASESSGLTVLAERLDGPAAATLHRAAVEASARPEALHTLRRTHLMVTAGVRDDGRGYYARSERAAGGWSTVYLLADPGDRGRLNLVAASMRRGPPEPWDLPRDGRLAGLALLAAALIEEAAADPPAADTPAADPPAADPVAPPGPPQAVAGRLRPGGAAPGRSGTGFFIAPRLVVSAAHVVEACAGLALADGTPLGLVASDAALDLAVMRAARPSGAWLALSPAPGPRLGQRVFAVGYPYFSLTGTALNVTSGNVSALAGMDDDRRFFALSAPVQPGNSGGPLVGADGGVLGVVVARLSDAFIAEATGSLPQNINYAVSHAELLDFLGRSGLAPDAGGLGGYSMDDGAPGEIETAVVPVLCR